MKRTAFHLLALITCFHVKAQQFGGFPPSTQWKQINTDTARIIFTKGAEWQANRIATLIHRAAADSALRLGNRLRKVDIVLHSRTTLANGYVALGPFRSEFYLIPGSNVFDFGNLPWHETLALHEYRHVQQYNNFRHGISKWMSYLFGEQGQALGNALTVPDWFFEGDAVHAETALTTQGRGRLPYFLSGYNSLWLEGKNYSWMKLRNGSLKDYVPNHYQLGYLLANYGYLKYGGDFWSKVTRDASAFRGLFYPFQRAVKRHAGVDYKTFRNEAFRFYKDHFGTVKDETVKKQRTVTNYYFPQYIGPDSLLYLKQAYNRIPAFYIRDNKGEHRIALRAISSEDWFGYRNGKIVYTAYSTDPRWSLVDYSDIILMDIKTGREKRLTLRERYFTPDLSPSGNRIIAVRINDSLQTELHLLDAKEGKHLQTIQPVRDYYFSHPRFVDEDRIVVGTRLPDATMALQLLHLPTGQWEQLLPFSVNSFSLPFAAGNTVYFTSNINGNDDLFAIRLKDKKIFQLTNEHAGNYYPSVSGDTLVWSHFTTNGLEIQQQALNALNWAEINALEVQEQRSLYPVAFEKNILGIGTERFASRRYEKSTGLFRFHSWAPAYSDPELTFSFYSNNILNTFSNELYYRYNQNENSNALGWNGVYGGWYPMLSAGLEYTYKREFLFGSNRLTLDQFEARVGANLPLNFTRSKFYRLLDFGSNYVFNRTIPTGFYKDSFQARNRSYLHHFVSWSHYLPRALQHIYPKFGYTFYGQVRHFISETGFSFKQNAQWLLNGQLFLPSLGNHSIVLSGAFQQVDTNAVSFSNLFANARGYSDLYFRKAWRLSGNYHFPIAYPDFGFANIVYLQRLRANLFFDYSRVFGGYFKNEPVFLRDLRSVGAELYFDTKWWNQLPVSFGIRFSHLLDQGYGPGDARGSNWMELVVPFPLFP